MRARDAVLAAPSGVQVPRIHVVPPYVSSAGPDVIEMCGRAGMVFDPWQQLVLADGLGETPEGLWSAFEVCTIVSRQNGKGEIFTARVLAGLFLFDERLLLYSCHEFKTNLEMFLRVKEIIDGHDDFRRRVRRIVTSHGEESIELLSGQRLRFVARSRGSGRGFSGETNIIDESFKLDGTHMSALLPTMSAMPNPQVWYGSSAGWEISEQLGRLRRRALAAKTAGTPDPSMAFFEWSAPDRTRPERYGDRRLWAQANPAMGYRITEDFVAKEFRTMGATEDFARERLGIGTYPADAEGWAVISEATWSDLADPSVSPGDRVGPVCLSAETTADRSMSAIGIAFRTADGLMHVEVVRFKRGSTWVVPKIVELLDKYDVCSVVIDKVGAASSFVDDLEDQDIEVVQPTAAEVTEAYGQFYDACVPADDEDGEPTVEPTLRHLGQEELNAAVAGAQTRKIGDREAWERKAGPHMPPLMTVTLALWGWSDEGDPLNDIL